MRKTVQNMLCLCFGTVNFERLRILDELKPQSVVDEKIKATFVIFVEGDPVLLIRSSFRIHEPTGDLGDFDILVQIYHFASDENYAVSWLEGIEGTK
jgi:hypothetical protein